MLKSEGYKMFRGSAAIRPFKCEPYEEDGDWLYKPEWNCWYVNGRSYPAEIVTDIFDREDEVCYVLMEKIQALEDMVATVENAAEIRKIIEEAKSLLIAHGRERGLGK